MTNRSIKQFTPVQAAIARLQAERAAIMLAEKRKATDELTKLLAAEAALHDQAAKRERALHRYHHDLNIQLEADREDARADYELAALRREQALHSQREATLKADYLATNAQFGLASFREQLPLRQAAMLERAKRGQFEDETNAAAAEKQRNKLLPNPVPADTGLTSPALEQLIINLEGRLKAAMGTGAEQGMLDLLNETLAELKAERDRIRKGPTS